VEHTAEPDSPDAPTSTGGLPGELDQLDQVEEELAQVEDALRRLNDGTYGRCESCGNPIEESALETSPLLLTCGGCSRVDAPLSPH
jgi:RNA polymerase-binding transcription factor DksA